MSYPWTAYKTWVTGEILTAADLNNTTQRAIDNSIPTSIDDYSSNAATMRSTADPYPGGSESLASTIAGELERIRYVIAQITGETYWYIDPDASIPDILTGNITISGNKTFSGGLTFSGINTFSNTNTFSGSTTFSGTTTLGTVAGTPTFSGAVTLSSTLAVSGVSTFPDGSVSAPSMAHAGDTNTGRFFGTDTINDVTAGATAHSIDSAGRNTFPLQPRFAAIASGAPTNITGDGTTYTVIFNSESYDVGSNYNNSTGIFTAPITGYYHFDATVGFSGLTSSHTTYILTISTGGGSIIRDFVFSGATISTNTLSASGDFFLQSGETAAVALTVIGGTKVVDISGASIFSGRLVA